MLSGGELAKEDEEELLTFVTYTAGVLNLSYNTVKTRLMAIRQAHLRAGCRDPLLGKERLWLLLRGLKRCGGPTVRKYPVTPEMLRWIAEELSPYKEDGSVDRTKRPKCGSHFNDTVLSAAIQTGYFYLLRSSEYLFIDGVGFDGSKCTNGDDISLEGTRATLHIRGSKTDQYNLGCIRTHSESGDGTVCPVRALRALVRAAPARKRGAPEGGRPLFRWEDGSGVKRTVVQAWLEMAAVACGLPPSRFGSHSLRIGGATALYLLTGEVETVKRFGRWASTSFSLYLWESVEAADGLAKGMVASVGRLEVSHGLGAEVSQRQKEQRRVRFNVGDTIAYPASESL